MFSCARGAALEIGMEMAKSMAMPIGLELKNKCFYDFNNHFPQVSSPLCLEECVQLVVEGYYA